MRIYFLSALLILSISVKAQNDSTKNSIITSVSVASKNFWRGNVYGDNTPTLSGTLGYSNKWLEAGITGTSPINGSRIGYGIWAETYITVKLPENLSITLDDYYFFNAYDSLNDYFNWSNGNTQHIIEYRAKYAIDRFTVMGSVVVYSAFNAVNSFYLESEYFVLPKELSISGGAVFGQSALNFFDKGGVAFMGVTGYRDIIFNDKFTVPLKVGVMYSPNYKNAFKAPGFTQNPINIIIGVSF